MTDEISVQRERELAAALAKAEESIIELESDLDFTARLVEFQANQLAEIRVWAEDGEPKFDWGSHTYFGGEPDFDKLKEILDRRMEP